MITNIAILGSTGSIGVNTLEVVSRLKGRFRVIGLAADSNIRLLAEQADRFRPRIVSVGDAAFAGKIKRDLSYAAKVVFGFDGLKEMVSRYDVGYVVFAIGGSVCLTPLMKAIEAKKKILLANKESLVSGGEIVMKAARRNAVKIIPIDSEHSAIFQCLEGRERFLSKIYLTGSGGPLLNVGKDRFDALPRRYILKHPKWKMGKKISVDSATMMNKGLEIIEAKHLFDVDESRIEVLIHPEAVIHSMVGLTDGTVFAQLGVADMRIPIQYALTYPDRQRGIEAKIDFARTARLSFYKPDLKKFPCLGLARSAALSGGTFAAVMCAADEVAVENYLNGRICFSDIPRVIEKVLSRHRDSLRGTLSLTDILEAEEWGREEARSICFH